MIEFFIEGNIPSLKNSKIKTKRGVFPSKTVTKFLREQGIQRYSVSKKEVTEYKKRPNKFENYREHFKIATYPVEIGFHFVRGSRHKFDFHNAVQILADLFVAHGFMEEDDMDHFIPYAYKKDDSWYSYDKDNPGVYVTINQ